MKRIIISGGLVLIGFVLSFIIIQITSNSHLIPNLPDQTLSTPTKSKNNQVIGFLPYWLINTVDSDHFKYLTTLAYFGLTVESDGTIQQYTNPGESEPGWLALESGKFKPPSGVQTSLVVFSGEPDTINKLISDPVAHAVTLVKQVDPIMDKYGFTDLNIDIENVMPASDSARLNFTTFIREVRNNLITTKSPNRTLTIDASPTDLIQPRMINLAEVEPFVDYVVLMTYDYHYSGSYVTGPIAPVGGAGTISEFDVETGIQKALEMIPSTKVILGVPLYGYEWETITDNPRSAIIPGSGIVASNKRVEELLAQCASCSARLEPESDESYVIYKDQETNVFHQIFFPDKYATQVKINVANKYGLAGLALWAMGYEGETILDPLAGYLK